MNPKLGSIVLDGLMGYTYRICVYTGPEKEKQWYTGWYKQDGSYFAGDIVGSPAFVKNLIDTNFPR